MQNAVCKHQAEATLRAVYRAVFRHRRKAALFLLGVISVTVLITFFGPRAYRSEGKLFVSLGRENVTPDPTATLGKEPVFSFPHSRESEVNSVVEVLKSRALVDQVVDRVGPGAVLASAGPLLPSQAGRLSDRDRAVVKLGKMLSVEPVRKSNVIRVTCEAHEPELAQAVVTKLIEAYLDQHVHLNRAAGAHEFLGEQTERLRLELVGREEQLRKLKSATGLASPQTQRELLVTRIARLEDDLLHASDEIAVAEATVGVLRDKLSSLPRTQVTAETTGYADMGTDAIRETFYTLQLKEEELRSMYTEAHPRMREFRQQTAAAAQLLDQQQRDRTQVTTAPDRRFEEAQLTLLEKEQSLASLQAKAGTLRTQLDGLREEQKALNENELRVADLQRDIELLDENYRKYATNLEQARLDRALEIEKISNINVVQPATYDPKPIRPRKAVNLLLGLVVGVLGGLGIAVVAEYLDHSFRTPEDVETRLELPALVSIPRLDATRLTLSGRN